MQNADDIDAARSLAIEQKMTADAVATVALPDLITGSTPERIRGDSLDRGSDLVHVGLGLANVPLLDGEIPDRGEIALRRRCEPIVRHDFFAAMNASKSNSSAAPLSSPAMSAARSAAI